MATTAEQGRIAVKFTDAAAPLVIEAEGVKVHKFGADTVVSVLRAGKPVAQFNWAHVVGYWRADSVAGSVREAVHEMYSAWITARPTNLIAAIKAVREATGLGLKQAK